MKALLFLLLFAGVGLASAAEFPRHVEIEYHVNLGPLKIGEWRGAFDHDGKTYKVVSTSRTVGLAAVLYPFHMVRRSSGRVTAQGLRTDLFEEVRNGKVKRRVKFDWEQKQALLFDGTNEQTVPLPDNTWDDQSFAYHFAYTARETTGQQVNLTDGRRIKAYEYKILGNERLKTVVGELDTVHVQKVNPPGDKSGFDTWIAPGYFNMPVRTRMKERSGMVFDFEVDWVRHSSP